MRKILCLLAIAVMIASCGKKSSESYYIPKDAIGVMYVNVESLAKKSSDINFSELGLSDFAENAPGDFGTVISEVMSKENMENTFRKEFILGFVSVDRMSGVGGFILPIKDAASFEKFLQPIMEKVPPMEKTENVGKGNAFTVYGSDELAIGWDGKTALIIGAKNYAVTELTDLTELDKSNSIYATDYYKGFFDTSKDMGIHVTSTPMATILNSLMAMASGLDVDIENNNLSYYLSFEDEYVHTQTKATLNKDFVGLLGYKDWMTTDYNKSMLNVLPKDPSIVMKLSVSPTAMYKHIEGLQDNKVIPAEARMGLQKSIRNMNRELKGQAGMTVEDIMGIFDGSMMMAVTEGITVKDTVYNQYSRYYGEDDGNDSYEIVDKKMPYVYAAISLKDKKKFDALIAIAATKGSKMRTKAKNHYLIQNDISVVITDDLIFITNNESKADEVSANGKLAENLSDFKYKSNLSHSGYIYMSSDVSEMSKDVMQSFTGSGYGVPGLDAYTDKSAKLYTEYFGDNHFFMDVDGIETKTYVKGDGNSLTRVMQYYSATIKELNALQTQSTY